MSRLIRIHQLALRFKTCPSYGNTQATAQLRYVLELKTGCAGLMQFIYDCMSCSKLYSILLLLVKLWISLEKWLIWWT